MRLNPHLSFDGNCREAFEFYEKCLGGKIQFMMNDPESDDRVYHATLAVGDQIITGGDAKQGMAVLFNLEDAGAAERIFQEMSEGGEVQMPLTETFWAARFGMVTDRFGIPWMINCAKPQSQES